ncbi:hypothetical protein [Pectinatus frisingensis]|uniref:hypothetical protein n=1 Tax=Pectinatus frisingensis TaxID=865 RepID=UPI0018C69978|nr:hypothetical protein [Pectinatus frisingensis]
MFDRNKFKYAVSTKGYTLENIADYLGINAVTLWRKMNGSSDFTRAEIQSLRGYLELSVQEVDEIFFVQ